MGSGSPDVEAIAASHRHDLYLLTSCDLPFVQDGLRDGETIRQWMTKRFEDVLTVLSAVSDGFKSQVAVTKDTPPPFPRLRNSLPKEFVGNTWAQA
jgi:nicotinamide riboside kinase